MYNVFVSYSICGISCFFMSYTLSAGLKQMFWCSRNWFMDCSCVLLCTQSILNRMLLSIIYFRFIATNFVASFMILKLGVSFENKIVPVEFKLLKRSDAERRFFCMRIFNASVNTTWHSESRLPRFETFSHNVPSATQVLIFQGAGARRSVRIFILLQTLFTPVLF